MVQQQGANGSRPIEKPYELTRRLGPNESYPQWRDRLDEVVAENGWRRDGAACVVDEAGFKDISVVIYGLSEQDFVKAELAIP